jgi:hypothetical protein
MKTSESLGVVIVVIVFIFFNFYVVRELGLLRADVTNINNGLSELRRESYRVADLQTSNAELTTQIVELRGNISALEAQMDVLAAFAVASHDEVEVLLNSSLGGGRNIVVITKRPTGTAYYGPVPDNMKEIQNLSEPNDQWYDFCFQERKTNTTLCYTRAT